MPILFSKKRQIIPLRLVLKRLGIAICMGISFLEIYIWQITSHIRTIKLILYIHYWSNTLSHNDVNLPYNCLVGESNLHFYWLIWRTFRVTTVCAENNRIWLFVIEITKNTSNLECDFNRNSLTYIYSFLCDISYCNVSKQLPQVMSFNEILRGGNFLISHHEIALAVKNFIL